MGAVPFAVGRREKLMVKDVSLGSPRHNSFKIKIDPGRELNCHENVK